MADADLVWEKNTDGWLNDKPAKQSQMLNHGSSASSNRMQMEAKLHIMRTGTAWFLPEIVGEGNPEGALLVVGEPPPWTEWIRRRMDETLLCRLRRSYNLDRGTEGRGRQTGDGAAALLAQHALEGAMKGGGG